LKGVDGMRNQKGFSLLELMAVIVLATTVLVPMLSGLIGNFEVNKRMHARKAASSITLTTISALDKVGFDNFEDAYLLKTRPESIVEITQGDCGDFDFTEPSPNYRRGSGEVCDMIFSQEWNSIKFDAAETFKVFLYPYYLDEAEINNILSLNDIPKRVLGEIEDLTPSMGKIDGDIYRVTVWIQYDQDTELDIVSSGVITRE
jgi:prepilin-type N-terminal cleavage/methylation domain-containing protein